MACGGVLPNQYSPQCRPTSRGLTAEYLQLAEGYESTVGCDGQRVREQPPRIFYRVQGQTDRTSGVEGHPIGSTRMSGILPLTAATASASVIRSILPPTHRLLVTLHFPQCLRLALHTQTHWHSVLNMVNHTLAPTTRGRSSASSAWVLPVPMPV